MLWPQPSARSQLSTWCFESDREADGIPPQEATGWVGFCAASLSNTGTSTSVSGGGPPNVRCHWLVCSSTLSPYRNQPFSKKSSAMTFQPQDGWRGKGIKACHGKIGTSGRGTVPVDPLPQQTFIKPRKVRTPQALHLSNSAGVCL